MPKPIKNFIVGVRHGGDTCYTTETLIVGAKSKRDAIAYAKAENGKHHHYSCHWSQSNPAVLLTNGMVISRNPVNKTNPKQLRYHPMRTRG